MNTTAERLQKALKVRGMKQTELATRTQIGKSSIHAYITGDYLPKQNNIYKMAQALDVSESWLMGYDVPMERGAVDTNLQTMPQKARGKAIRVPVLGSVPAGTPIEAIEDIIDWEEIPEAMASGGREYFALKVTGDSMYPKYLEGDTIIVRRQDTFTSGADCVVYVNGYDATLKTVKETQGGGITLQPVNPNYPPRTYSQDEIRTLPVSIAGVVVELRRKINT
ncbi:MAG: XRE family transcriptional regulator [Clostridiales bacterium]|nr:XRE family transcriptional regulator [Clostridiales bacterium]